MDTYSTLRHFADSWGLLAMCLFYVGAILWVFRPGSRAFYRDAAEVPFRHERAPSGAAEPCRNACPDCSCERIPDFLAKEGA